jgi:hypothetical protein
VVLEAGGSASRAAAHRAERGAGRRRQQGRAAHDSAFIGARDARSPGRARLGLGGGGTVSMADWWLDQMGFARCHTRI